MSLPKACKGRIYSSFPHQLYLKIKINQSSFWHHMTGQIMDSVFNMSFNCFGSRRNSCSESGVTPRIMNISGLPSHLPNYLCIFRVFNKKMFKKKKRSCSQKSESTTLEKSENFLKLSFFSILENFLLLFQSIFD